MSLLDVAQEYLSAGLRPIPVKCQAKSPGLPGGKWKEYQKRPPTQDELTQWFDESGTYHDANIGTVIPPRHIVIDFDGGKAAEALLVAAGVALPPETPRVMSGSGGYHMYLQLPEGTPDFAKIPGSKFLFTIDADGKPCKPFVEILTVNNFVVLPPSVHPNGRPYKWMVELDGLIPEIPPALATLISAKRGGHHGVSRGRRGSGTLPAPPGGLGNEPGWVEELSKGTGPGTHDDSMTKLAGHYLRKGLSVANVIDIIDSGYGRRCWQASGPCRIPLADIKRVVESIQRAEAGKGKIEQTEFQLLGYDRDKYFYLSKATGQLVELTARNHDKNNLLRVASLRYWEAKYGGENGIVWSAAQANLLDAQHKTGIFDPDRIRGRGAWWDEGVGAIMHTGENLLTGGRTVPVRALSPGRYVYELSRPLDVELGKPMDLRSAGHLLSIFDNLCWVAPQSPHLAAGWCVIATICGAVSWRPHLWLTGPSGTGKSWTIDYVIRRLLGNLALTTLSETTGAGLRQTLGHDARPIIFDEAEAEGTRGDARMAEILALMRQSSSESGGTIIKGSADGTAKTYRVRSCFMMSSVNISAYQAADRNRITILEMGIDPEMSQEERDTRFANLRARVAETLTDEHIASFRSRCVKMIPVIRSNANLFSIAASGHIGSRRLGDQVGTLLAGAFSLLSDDEVTPAQAEEAMGGQDFSEQKAIQAVSDEVSLLEKILQHVVRVPAPGGTVDRNVGSLIKFAAGLIDNVSAADAAHALLLIGIKMDAGRFIVANQHTGIENILRGTHWCRDWGRVLKRLPDAVKGQKVRFGEQGNRRGTSLSVDLVE